MPFDKRRAYVEFLGQETVTIVTSYKNKTFKLDSDCVIDLISLNKSYDFSEDVSGFYAKFEFDAEEKRYYCAVYMKTCEDGFSRIGEANICDNKKIFSGNVWVPK